MSRDNKKSDQKRRGDSGKRSYKKKTVEKKPERQPRPEKGKRNFDQYKNRDINEMDLPKMKEEKTRLNKYLSNAGICSRREADGLIKLGLVTVNGEIVVELGVKVSPGDVVKYDGATISRDKYRYVLLNKPKNYLTTNKDPKGRRTVMALVKNVCKEVVFPVGKLDRNTTGLLLFTNDGDLARKLTNPKRDIEKLYFIQLAEKVKSQHMDMLREGVNIEDGFVKAEEIEYVKNTDDQRLVGVKVLSNKSKVARKMFEYFGYTITKIDRVMYAGLTKKDLSRGYCRHLTEKEVAFLKMMN